jgi:glycosyltransferase involved in cell wall biosynthesis
MSKPYRTKRFSMIFKTGFGFYAEYNIRLFFYLLSREKELLYANDLDTLPANFLVSRMGSVPLVYDSHEYFTEVPELIHRPRVRSFWLRLEEFIVPRLKNVITVNKELAKIYSEKYRVPVAVVRNVASINSHGIPMEPKPGNRGDQKPGKGEEDVLIYQGALNLGRGIELMIDCMAYLENCILLIAGRGDISTDLKRRAEEAKLNDRIQFLGRTDPESLRELTRKASLGLSLEEDLGLNYRYALPNKIFDYIHAGIPVIVSDLPVMGNFVLENKVGAVLTERNSKALAQLIMQVLSERRSYDSFLRDAAGNYNWDKEKVKLLKLIENLE